MKDVMCYVLYPVGWGGVRFLGCLPCFTANQNFKGQKSKLYWIFNLNNDLGLRYKDGTYTYQTND